MSIKLENLRKKFGSHIVVDQFSLEVASGELFVLLGASGSGKSSILRQIAGLSAPDGGKIFLNDREVTHLTPQQRDVGFVFQNYSIFRHMNVIKNIEFGLKIKGITQAQREKKCEELLELVGLTGLGQRYTSQLSGGQQQRVALARALAYEPKVLLLDEPFGALDVKIRAQLRRNLKQIQRRLQITTILVTHDQEEAFELADRIGIVERGRLLETGTPLQLYNRPNTFFTATFLGVGTLLIGRVIAGQAHLGSIRLPIPNASPHEEGGRVQVFFRPENIRLSLDPPQENTLTLGKGHIIETSFVGTWKRLRIRLPRLKGVRQLAPSLPFGEEGLIVEAMAPTEKPLESSEHYVILNKWHILDSSQFNLLYFQATSGKCRNLKLTRYLAKELVASLRVLLVSDLAQTTQTKSQFVEENLSAEFQIREGDALEQLILEQGSAVYDLMIIPVSDRKGSTNQDEAFLIRLLEGINQQGVTPVLFAREPTASFNHILICTAAGEPGKHVVTTGGRLARRLKAKVSLLYVAKQDSEINPLVTSHLENAAKTLEALDLDTQVLTHVSPSPAEAIKEVAASGPYDLVVIGSHGPSAHLLRAQDDITSKVFGMISKSLLVVPPDYI